MKKTKKILIFVIPICLVLGLLSAWFWAQEDPEECEEVRINFTDTFDSTDYKDPGSSVRWDGDGVITLNYLGANFSVIEPSGMGAKIYVCDSGDFTGDGLPDLVGLDISDSGNRKLILVRNKYLDETGDGEDDDGIILEADPTELYDENMSCGPASLTVADYNGDGLLDFFFYKNNADAFSYSGFVAAMYINTGTAEDPDFSPYESSPSLNFSDRFMDAGIYANWAGDHLCSVDIDDDDDMDILAISQDKIFLIRNPGAGQFDLDHFEITEINYDQRTGFSSGRGGSSVDAADFDMDGDIDIIGGTVQDIAYLVLYENDGNENYTRKTISIPEPDCTGTVATCVADFNHDGYIDIFAATDRWNAGNYAHMWFQKNLGIVGGEEGELTFEFRCLNNCEPILPDPHDVDMSAVLDYDQDGDMDVILADANHSGDYYLVINDLADVYTLHGEARSINVSPDLDPATEAITRVRISRLDQNVTGGSSDGLAVEYYVSNNGGRNWEFYARFGEEGELESSGDIINYTGLPWHSFTHFGSQLKWKAILTAEEDEMAEYEGGSFESPLIDRIRLRYSAVDRREYSRTSVATRVLDDEGQDVKLIIAGTFYFPGWQGHLRAYDVTNVAPESSSYSELRTITRPDLSDPPGRELVAAGVSIRWDAGDLLDIQSPAARTIYTAIPEGVESDLTRLDFTTANVDQLAPHISDFQNNNSGLIDFIRGEGREWKLGDINHSNPVIIGPPDGVSITMGAGYDLFMGEWEDRTKTLIVGTNDGMLHCFNVLTGEEMWAFIPYNLLSKVRNLWPVDEATGERYFARDVYVDGSPVTADVYIDDEWKTVLICGQGAGQGLAMGENATGNYYFALDITNIEDPQPMWEFTEERMGETWSVPVIGRILKDSVPTWTAFMGSGYDNVTGQGRQGHRLYAVDIANGEMFWYFNANPEVNTKASWSNGKNCSRSIPGSPAILDIDADGSADRVYVGDREGRFWKVDVSIEYLNADPWEAEVIYEDPDNYPIITKPAVWLDPGDSNALPRMYFGTGGDDSAPADALYSFIALIDDPNASNQEERVEWFMGDPDVLNLSEEKDVGDLAAGEKVWADPKIPRYNYTVYFSTLTGNIETVDPCESISGVGRLYGRFIKSVAGSPIGGTAFRTAGGSMENLGLEIKTRAAVTLGETERAGGVRKQEVYIQEYDSTIQKLEQPSGALLKVKSWREIIKIKK